VRLHHRTFDVSIDYHQFYLWDRGMTDQAPEQYTDEDVSRRIKTGPHVVVIQPERNDTVPVALEVHDADPGFEPSGWDHIAEASLELPTGRLQVHECLGGPVAEIAVEPGWYRVRSHHGGLGSVQESGAGEDRYLAVLWPDAPSEVKVIKQWAPADEGAV
jgi:hypothetical protein